MLCYHHHAHSKLNCIRSGMESQTRVRGELRGSGWKMQWQTVGRNKSVSAGEQSTMLIREKDSPVENSLCLP